MRHSKLSYARSGDILVGAACLGALCFLNGCGGGGSHKSDTTKSEGVVLSFSAGRLATPGVVQLSDLSAAGGQITVRVREDYDQGETDADDAKTGDDSHFIATLDKTYTDTVDNSSTVIGYDSDSNPVYGTSQSTTYNIIRYNYAAADRCSSTVVENFVGETPIYSIPGVGNSADRHHISALMQQAATVAQNAFPDQPVLVVSDDEDACTSRKL